LKKILAAPEYKNSDCKKTVNVEIREWFVPIGNDEETGLKVLVFMIAKN
jgi:hypothetical protein